MQKNILCFLFVAIFSAVFLCTSALAVPTLQLDISDPDQTVTYNTVTETIVTYSRTSTLYALLSDKKLSYFDTSPSQGPYMSDPFYISAALVPVVENPATTYSFTIGGVTYDQGSPALTGTPAGLPQHDIFPADKYWEVSFQFATDQWVNEYNTQDNPGGFPSPLPMVQDKKILYYYAFGVDTTGLGADYTLHFDLYHLSNNPGHVDEFAPFSHDAATAVPEPATMLLFGTGLIGIAAIGRKKFRKK
jgi:hypothetical protein